MISETDFCRMAPEDTRVVMRSRCGETCVDAISCWTTAGASVMSRSTSAGGVGWSAIGFSLMLVTTLSVVSRSTMDGSGAVVVGVGSESTAGSACSRRSSATALSLLTSSACCVIDCPIVPVDSVRRLFPSRAKRIACSSSICFSTSEVGELGPRARSRASFICFCKARSWSSFTCCAAGSKMSSLDTRGCVGSWKASVSGLVSGE